MQRLLKWFRRTKNNVNYALLYHKVSRRLGAARSAARQLRQENAFYRARAVARREQILELRAEVKRLRVAYFNSIKENPTETATAA